MKKILSPIIMMLFAALLLSVIPTEAEAAIYEDTVRLHILAPSDSAEDQAVKLAVRDTVLKKYSSELSDLGSSEEARARLLSLLPDIEETVNEYLLLQGYAYGAKVELKEEWYGTREYSGFTLPAGLYSSLVITLGKGEGQNWWCVMYPPLCLDIATDGTEGYTESENRLITAGGYRIKFKLLELISSLCR